MIFLDTPRCSKVVLVTRVDLLSKSGSCGEGDEDQEVKWGERKERKEGIRVGWERGGESSGTSGLRNERETLRMVLHVCLHVNLHQCSNVILISKVFPLIPSPPPKNNNFFKILTLIHFR